MEFDVVVPRAGSNLHNTLLKGSAIIVARESGDDHLLVYFEGNKYNACNIKTFEDKCLHAAGRLIEHYPTVARTYVKASEVIKVGRYHYQDRVFRLNKQAKQAFTGWTSEQGSEE